MSRVNSPQSFQTTEFSSMTHRRDSPLFVGDSTDLRPRAVRALTPTHSSHRSTLRDIFVILIVIATLSTRLVVAEVASHTGSMTTSTSSRSRQSSSVRHRIRHTTRPHSTIASIIGDSDLEEFDYDMGSCRPDNCTTREIKRLYHERKMQRDIFRKLRLKKVPNITRKHLPAIPNLQSKISLTCQQKDVSCGNSTMDTDGRMQNDEQDNYDEYHATTETVTLFPVTGGKTYMNNSNVIRFNVQPDSINGDVVHATLGVFIRRPQYATDSARATWFLVYARGGVDGSERAFVCKKEVELRDSHGDRDTNRWISASVNISVISKWLRSPLENHGLEIQLNDGNGNPLPILRPSNEDEQPYAPYLEIKVRGGRQLPRTKRQLGNLDCEDLSVETRCCRFPLVIDFDELKWDWVIVPRRYSAYYCAGDCPLLYYQTGLHSHMRQQASPATANAAPCCTAKKTSAISMLYYNENMEIVLGRLPGMIVEQCGCS